MEVAFRQTSRRLARHLVASQHLEFLGCDSAVPDKVASLAGDHAEASPLFASPNRFHASIQGKARRIPSFQGCLEKLTESNGLFAGQLLYGIGDGFNLSVFDRKIDGHEQLRVHVGHTSRHDCGFEILR